MIKLTGDSLAGSAPKFWTNDQRRHQNRTRGILGSRIAGVCRKRSRFDDVLYVLCDKSRRPTDVSRSE